MFYFGSRMTPYQKILDLVEYILFVDLTACELEVDEQLGRPLPNILVLLTKTWIFRHDATSADYFVRPYVRKSLSNYSSSEHLLVSV